MEHKFRSLQGIDETLQENSELPKTAGSET